jgi:hypothetical protein
MFAQVVLDTAAILQKRHEQLLQLSGALGVASCSHLACALQPGAKVRPVIQEEAEGTAASEAQNVVSL